MKNLAVNFIRDNKAVQVFLAFIVLIVLTCLVGKIFPTFAGVILCLLLMGGYYGVLLRCLKFCKVNFLDELINDLPRILAVAVIGTGFIVFMINSQQTIHFWDSLETWEPTVECANMTFADPHQALKDLRASINHSDYNKFLSMLMALPMYIFGKSFLCYELYVWLMFGLPGIFIAAATFRNVLDGAGVKVPCSAIMAIVMLLPTLEIPIFLGYANISILLPCSILLAMLLSLDKAQLQRDRLIYIAALCVFAVFQARTAVYMILGLFLGYTVYLIISSTQERSLQRDLVMLVKKFLYIGAFGLIMTLPLFFTFIKHALTYDIGTAYVGYQRGLAFPERILFHAEYLGLIIYALFVIGAAISFANKKFFPFAAFLLTWALVPAILICRVQIMDRQHFYTIILPLAIFIVMLISFVLSKKKLVGAALVCVLAFNFCQAFSATFNVPKLFQFAYPMPVRHDIDDLKKFVDYLNQLTKGTDKKIYLLASGPYYNGHVLTKIYFPENENALPSLMNTADVDAKDGFAPHFFDADYILVTNPIQLHLQAEDQSIVVMPAKWLENPSPLSKHFKKIKEQSFSLGGNGVASVTFELYEKISPLEKADIDFVEEFFAGKYPDKDDLFKNRFEHYKREHFKD